MTEPLQPDEQALRHALDDPLLQELRGALAAEAQQMDPETGLAQLHQRLHAPRARTSSGANTSTSAWRRLLASLPSLTPLAPLAVTALASVCVVQSWLLWHGQADDSAGAPLAWRSVAGEPAPAASLRVHFRPGATLDQLSAALEAAQAGIVAGPLSDHSYLLDAADAEAARRSLQASGLVVDIAPLAGPAPQ